MCSLLACAPIHKTGASFHILLVCFQVFIYLFALLFYSFVLLLLFLCLLCSFTCFSFYFFSILFLIKLKEYCAGGNLRELLDKPYMLTPALRRSIACDIAAGLRYLHSWNPPIIHRDLTRFLSSPSYASLVLLTCYFKLIPCSSNSNNILVSLSFIPLRLSLLIFLIFNLFFGS